MFKRHVNRPLKRRRQIGALPKDLYAYAEVHSLPRIGRPQKFALETWTVTDNWPDLLPVTEAEIDLFEAWFGDLLDETFGPS